MRVSAGSAHGRDRGDSRRCPRTVAFSRPDRGRVGIWSDLRVCFGAPQHPSRDIAMHTKTGSFILIERDAIILIERGALQERVDADAELVADGLEVGGDVEDYA